MSGYTWLGAALGLGLYAALSSLLSVLLALGVEPLLRAGLPAATLFRWRLLPAAVSSVLVAGFLLPAYLVWEPRETREPVGAPLVALAVFGLALAGLGIWRAVCAVSATARLARARRSVQPLDLAAHTGLVAPLPALACDEAWPAVAVVGLFFPRLYVSRQALALLAPAELRAVLAHERAHLRHHDNLRSLVLRACPDLLGWLPAGRRLVQAWAAASERAADDAAAAGGSRCALDLAEALVKVARLAEPGPQVVPATALVSAFHGGDLAARVRRLLRTPSQRPPAPEGPHRRRWALTALAAALALAMAWQPHVLRATHTAIETLVRALA